jgi:hypothetical protein
MAMMVARRSVRPKKITKEEHTEMIIWWTEVCELFSLNSVGCASEMVSILFDAQYPIEINLFIDYRFKFQLINQ